MFNFKRNYKNFKRAKDIVTVIARYGLGYVFNQSRLLRYLKLRKTFFKHSQEKEKVETLTLPERVRMVCEELGPTFIKMGQILSTRPDLIPPEFIKELNKLQDEVPPFEFKEVEKRVKKEFGQPIEKLFSQFNKNPIAAASLSQVHKARLKNGKWVAVKIQRPGIRAIVDSDIAVLKDLAAFMEKRFTSTQLYQPAEIVEEFQRTIKKELDFITEGKNIDIFKTHFQETPAVHIPKVYWDLTSSRILTMEYIRGEKLSRFLKEENATDELNSKKVAQIAADMTFKQIFEDGFFHADPHPGNLLVEENNSIALLDFGMVGKLDGETLSQLTAILMGVVKGNAERIITTMEEMEIVDMEMNLKRLKYDIQDLIDKYYGLPLKQIQMNKIIPEILYLVRKHQIKIPVDLALLAKTSLSIEGTVKRLDPEFDVFAHAKPFAKQLIQKKYSFSNLWKKGGEKAREVIHLMEILPNDIFWFLKALKRGKVSIGFEHKGLERLIQEIDRATNRIALSLIIAALIIGSSLILRQDVPPFILGYPAVGIIGFLIASFLGLGLIISILKSGRWK